MYSPLHSVGIDYSKDSNLNHKQKRWQIEPSAITKKNVPMMPGAPYGPLIVHWKVGFQQYYLLLELYLVIDSQQCKNQHILLFLMNWQNLKVLKVLYTCTWNSQQCNIILFRTNFCSQQKTSRSENLQSMKN